MVAQFAGAVITDLERTLQTARRTFLFGHHIPRYVREHRIEPFHIHAAGSQSFPFAAFAYILRQLIRFGITLLFGDMLHDLIHLRCIHKRTLYTGNRGISGIEAVAAADQLLRSLRIQHRTAVDHTLRAKRDTRRDIRFDHTRHDIDTRTLGCQDHVHAYGARFLRDTGDRRLHLLARLHDEIAVLVDDDDDIGQVLVMQTVAHQLVGIQPSADELVVVVLQIAHARIHQQFVPVLHLDHQRIQCVHHLVAVGDDDLLRIGVRHRR